MGEDKTNMFGKTYNTVGSTDSNFIIKTKGDLKILWGNKFIDLIKNGKVVSSSNNLFKIVSNINDISSNGIYILNNNEDQQVWIYIDGNKINLLGEVGTTYVSFIGNLENVSIDLKYNALKNIGFYYDTLSEAQECNIKAGIIYIQEKNKLYLAKEGKLTEYDISSENISNEDTKLNELFINTLHIYSDNNIDIIDSPNLKLTISGLDYVILQNSVILLLNSLEISKDKFLQSLGASSDEGFRLYNIGNKSILEVDSVIERDKQNLEESTFLLYQLEIKSLKSNIILTSIDTKEIVILEEEEYSIVECVLKYNNEFIENEYIYTYLPEENTKYIIDLNLYTLDGISYISAELQNLILSPELILIEVIYDNSSKTTILEILKDLNRVELLITYTNNLEINNLSILKGPTNITFSNSEKKIILNKPNINEYLIYKINDLNILILVLKESLTKFINQCKNVPVYKSNSPLIKIENENIVLLDRSKITEEEDKEKLNETIHTKIGSILEQDFDLLKECPVLLKEVNVGIYSDNFIGLNSKLYDTIFKKRCDYPKYDATIILPEDKLDEKYNNIVPNIEWVKKLLEMAIPSGTIVMYNGKSSIPEGWVICDGNNGTPNLVGKFVKAVSSFQDVGDNNTDLDNENKLLIREENLPPHSHPHSAHSHNITSSSITGSSGSLSMTSSDTFAYNLYKTSVVKSVSGVEGISTSTTDVYNDVSWRSVQSTGGSHTHSISSGSSTLLTTSLETNKTWTNKAIKVEPHSYSLIFIMKL